MALINCPECSNQISDKATSCPHCGYPLTTPNTKEDSSEVQATPNTEGPSSQPKKRHFLRLFCIILAIVITMALLIVFFVLPFAEDNMGYAVIYNHKLGVEIELGQNKESVDDLLGSPIVNDDMYTYSDRLKVWYEDGCVSLILVDSPESTWAVKGNIGIGYDSNNVIDQLGYCHSVIGTTWFYYLNPLGMLSSNIDGAKGGVALKISMGQVTALYLSNRFESNALVLPSDPIKADAQKSFDDRGIPGMKANTIRLLLDSTFDVPWTNSTPAPSAAGNLYASSCTSGFDSGLVFYDYSITMDGDEEIVGASFGITATKATEVELLQAADLYFYAIAILPYDTTDQDVLVAWFEETLPNLNNSESTIVVGDATFTLYGTSGLMYWVDIQKSTS